MLKVSDVSKERRIARGIRAEALMTDEVLQDVLQELEDRWLQAIVTSTPKEVDAREQAYRMLYTAKQFRAELLALLNDAKVLSMK